MGQPWEKRDDETSKAFEAFTCYLELGVSRSAQKVAEELTKSEGMIRRWSARHDWVSRANAWDGHLAEQRRDEARRGERFAAAETMFASNKIFRAIRLCTDQLIEEIEKGDFKFTCKDLLHMAQAAKILREQSGEFGKLLESLSERPKEEWREAFDNWLDHAQPGRLES